MNMFRVKVIAANPKQENVVSAPQEALVDTSSKLTWLPADVLRAIGITPRREREFVTASKQILRRQVGYAILRAEGYETNDDVVFGEANDMVLLGVRTLDGFGVIVDNGGKRLAPTTTIDAVQRTMDRGDPRANGVGAEQTRAPKSESRVARVLDALAKLHGSPRPSKAANVYELLIFTNCGYPASERTCAAGFAALKDSVGVSPVAILRASTSRLATAMRKGGIIPEVRAVRLREIAEKTLSEFNGSIDLSRMSLAEARKVLKTFPTIGDPGADKVLLFSHTMPLAAVPSNATQVPLRLGFGAAQSSYAASYRSAQAALDAELAPTSSARIRAYLLFKKHGEEICKRSRPQCERCPVCSDCPYFANNPRPIGTASAPKRRTSKESVDR